MADLFTEREDEEYQELLQFFQIWRMKDIDILFNNWLVNGAGDLLADLKELKAEITENGWRP